MKHLKFFLSIVFLFLCCFGSHAQQRINIADGITLVSYGNNAVIEDDNKKCSISLTISQQNLDHKNGQRVYNVACKGITKTVAKAGLKQAIAFVISSAGYPTIAKYASSASGYIYDAVCNYYSDKYE